MSGNEKPLFERVGLVGCILIVFGVALIALFVGIATIEIIGDQKSLAGSTKVILSTIILLVIGGVVRAITHRGPTS